MKLEGYFDRVGEAANFLSQKVTPPKIAVVLSGGLETFVDGMRQTRVISSKEIPHFPRTRVEGHKGELIFGQWGGVPVVALKGRIHYYEGVTPQEVVFPYFVLRDLGCDFLVTTNAAGGVRNDLKPGDIMAVTDHINLMGANPLVGLTVQYPKNQFPSMQDVYDPELLRLAERVAREQNIELKKGIFLANIGPSYETPAEIRTCRSLGADTVGMSTVFENIASKYLQMRVLTLNIIANDAADRHGGKMSHQEVLAAMKKSAAKVVTLLEGVVSEIAKLV